MAGPALIGPEHGGQRYRPLLRTMIGDALRRTRLEQERTLSDVARSASVSMPYLSEIERGRKEASSEVLAAICDALGIGLSDLLEQVGRELAGDRAERAGILRIIALDGGFGGPASPGSPGRGQATCLLVA